VQCWLRPGDVREQGLLHRCVEVGIGLITYSTLFYWAVDKLFGFRTHRKHWLILGPTLGGYNDPALCQSCGVDFYDLFKDSCNTAYAVSDRPLSAERAGAQPCWTIADDTLAVRLRVSTVLVHIYILCTVVQCLLNRLEGRPALTHPATNTAPRCGHAPAPLSLTTPSPSAPTGQTTSAPPSPRGRTSTPQPPAPRWSLATPRRSRSGRVLLPRTPRRRFRWW
jgi:hypothetical protein